MWLLAMQYVVHLLNFLASETLHWQVPLQMLWGFTPDASVFLAFHFWEHILYACDDTFPSTLPEKPGRVVGFALGVGDALTFQILDDTSKELLFRSAIRPKDPGKKSNDQLLLIEEDDNPPDDTMDAVIFHSEGLSGVQVDTVLDTNLPQELMDKAILVEGEEDDSALESQIADNLREHDKVCQDKIKKNHKRFNRRTDR
jgi:hypothetical protein